MERAMDTVMKIREGFTRLDSRFFQGSDDILCAAITKANGSVGAEK
jgi:hypothetical protein